MANSVDLYRMAHIDLPCLQIIVFLDEMVSNDLSAGHFSLPACVKFYHLLKTFASSLDPDQAQQNVGPELDQNCLSLLLYS